MDIKVYNQEIKDGVDNLVRANASIAYLVQPKIIDDDNKQNKITASLLTNDRIQQKDLYYLECILASVGWNGNDDVFAPEDTFLAKDTPVDKPVNFMHNENDIIGHMVASSVIDETGNIITAPTEKFDIVAASVIYKSWDKAESRERIAKIINEIPEGKWFVSMECLFPNFDYAIITPNGEQKVIARNEESSFLTKHLRVYGGNGEFNGNKVGRLLRNFFFSGKGIVDNPANKRSIIFTNVSTFNGTSASLKTLNKGRTMDIEMIKAQLEEAKKALAEEKAKTETYQAEADKVVATKMTELEKTISELQKVIAEKDESIKTSSAQNSELSKTVSEKDAKIAELTKANVDLQSQIIKTERLSKLAVAGITGDEAEKLVVKFASASDDIFGEFVALKSAKKDEEEKEKMDKSKCAATPEEDKTGESKAQTTDLDNLKTEESAALLANTAKANETRSLVNDFIKSKLKTTVSKNK